MNHPPVTRNRFPMDVHYDPHIWLVQADMNTEACPAYAEVLKRFPYSDGMRDNTTCESHGAPDVERVVAMLRDQTKRSASTAAAAR